MVGPIKPDIAPILAIQKQQLIADPNKQHAGNLIQAAQIAGVSSKVSNVTTDKDFGKVLAMRTHQVCPKHLVMTIQIQEV